MNREIQLFSPKSMFLYGLGFAAAIVIGLYLRLFDIQSQVLLDDEWHAMLHVLKNSFLSVMVQPGFAANSVPYNIYIYLLMKTVGWSETLLRLPSILAGALSLLIWPWYLGRISRVKTAHWFCWFLAISPFLIFYSRVARPYMPVAFFGFLAILAWYRWVMGGRHRNAALYAICSILAVHLSMSVLPSIVAPFLLTLALKIKDTSIKRDAQQIFFVGMNTLLIIAVLSVPATLDRAWLEIPLKYGDRVTFQTVGAFLELLSGTAQPVITAFFVGLLMLGLLRVLKEMPILGWIFLAVYAVNILTVSIASLDMIHTGIVVSRYMICLFPLSLFCVASGVVYLLDLMRSKFLSCIAWILCGGLVALLFFKGPLMQSYSRPNNFTNHSAFQEHYGELDWAKSYPSDMDQTNRIHAVDVPDYYRQLSANEKIRKIIEYPMFIGDHFNLFYYYQHFHRKEVLVGYQPYFRTHGMSRSQRVFSDNVMDQILKRFSNTEKLHFKKIVNLKDEIAIKASGADVIIIHKRLGSEMAPEQPMIQESLVGLPIPIVIDDLKKKYKSPVYEDEALIVFAVKGALRP